LFGDLADPFTQVSKVWGLSSGNVKARQDGGTQFKAVDYFTKSFLIRSKWGYAGK
jgi:hypothetical protein